MFDIHQCACLSKAVDKTNPSDENTRNGIRELYIRGRLTFIRRDFVLSFRESLHFPRYSSYTFLL